MKSSIYGVWGKLPNKQNEKFRLRAEFLIFGDPVQDCIACTGYTKSRIAARCVKSTELMPNTVTLRYSIRNRLLQDGGMPIAKQVGERNVHSLYMTME